MSLASEKLKARIGERGPLTFHDFMESALYDPDFGYYVTDRQKIGAAGDYYTSSNVHAAFGAAVAALLVNLLSTLVKETPRVPTSRNQSTSDRHDILEVGAGTGLLAHDILAVLQAEHPEVYSRIKYVIAERSPVMMRRQHEKLARFAGKVQWAGVTDPGYPNVESINGIVISNELIDALPVHVIRVGNKNPGELYVTCDERGDSIHPRAGGSYDQHPHIAQETTSNLSTSSGGLGFAWGPLSSERVRLYLDRIKVPLAEGQVIEVNLNAVDWLRAVARILTKGYIVTIDYGDLAEHLYGEDRRRGTLRAFHKHMLAPSVLDRIGEQDLTSSVNFTALIDYGRDAGLEAISFERQSSFLVRMGLIDRIAHMETSSDAWNIKDRLAIKNLFVPGASSDNFRVLIQRKVAP